MSTTQPETFKVGQLARSMGLTVRTLHHYDALGLVRPSARNAAGHRVYSAADVQRLYQVVALRQLGLSLDAVATVVGGTDQLAVVLAAHHDRLNQQLAAVRDAVDLLAVLRDKLHGAEQPSTGDFLELIRKVVMADETVKKYFDSHQLAELEERHQQDPEAASRVQQGWAELLPEVDAALAAGPTRPVHEARPWPPVGTRCWLSSTTETPAWTGR